ncbi:uncharacterized protein DNG_02734 [Cephalotrichum gorgonifer]|uniref:Uncharacterized protein n=1 Tax=Cephalotrichum gorgonifer TaxID=2041049 RepID=A0AAE8MV24_9PEZI|nr:uncharacterized protein DNG_02734 [Cephalotrichum gorgonifer]
MATNQIPKRPGIPLKYTASNPYRLLELPPDLLELLESDSPPTLHLEPGTPNAVLVAPGKRYILTQRNTSNSLILLSPEGETGGLGIVGTMHETIEVTPEPAKK